MEAAQHWYHEALAIHPSYQNAWNNLGCVLTELGKYDEAIAHFETALRLDPTLVSAHNSLGTALLKQGKTDEALRHFLEALRLRPDLPRPTTTWPTPWQPKARPPRRLITIAGRCS